MGARVFDIDIVELQKWMNSTGKDPCELSESIGREKSFFYNVIRKGKIGFTPYKMILRTYNLPEKSFIKDYQAKNATSNEQAVHSPPQKHGYSLDMQVFPDKLRLAILFDNQEIKHCFVHIRGESELDLMQAISYAAHMLYKYAQSDNLESCIRNANK